MTLPADRNLNDTLALGPLTAGDFDTYTTPETAMLIGHDTEFQDTMAMPRRHTLPMDFQPQWYRGSVAACSGGCRQGRDECPTRDACRVPVSDDEDGPMEFIAYTLVAVAFVLVAAGVLGLLFLL